MLRGPALQACQDLREGAILGAPRNEGQLKSFVGLAAGVCLFANESTELSTIPVKAEPLEYVVRPGEGGGRIRLGL